MTTLTLVQTVKMGFAITGITQSKRKLVFDVTPQTCLDIYDSKSQIETGTTVDVSRCAAGYDTSYTFNCVCRHLNKQN